MASRRDAHHAHKAAVAGLGKVLSKRARNVCELCTGGSPLGVVEVEPVYETPDPERAALLCMTCREVLDTKPQYKLEATALRFLEEVVWSDVLPVQLSAVRLLRRLSSEDVVWARDCLDGLYLDESVEALLQ